MGGKTGLRIVSSIIKIIAALCAIALVVLIPWKLTNVSTSELVNNPTLNNARDSVKCLLTSPSESQSVRTCAYGIGLGAIAIIFTLILGILSCVTCGCFGASGVFHAIGMIALTIWWAVGAAVIIPRAIRANQAGVMERDIRIGVIAAIVGGVVTNGIGVLVEVAKLF